jgi:hypothetical protein
MLNDEIKKKTIKKSIHMHALLNDENRKEKKKKKDLLHYSFKKR